VVHEEPAQVVKDVERGRRRRLGGERRRAGGAEERDEERLERAWTRGKGDQPRWSRSRGRARLARWGSAVSSCSPGVTRVASNGRVVVVLGSHAAPVGLAAPRTASA